MKRVLMLLAIVLIVAQLAATYTPAGPVDASPTLSMVALERPESSPEPPAPTPEVDPQPEPPAPEVKPEPAKPKTPSPKPGYRYECGPYGCKLVPVLPSTTVVAEPVQSCQGGQCYTQPSVRYQPVRRGWFGRWRR